MAFQYIELSSNAQYQTYRYPDGPPTLIMIALSLVTKTLAVMQKQNLSRLHSIQGSAGPVFVALIICTGGLKIQGHLWKL